MQVVALSLGWVYPNPKHEYVMVENYEAPRSPDFQFYDIDGSKIRCYWNETGRAGPRVPAHLDFVTSEEELQQLLDAVVTDVQIETSSNAYSLRLFPNAIAINQSMSSGTQTFLQNKVIVFNNGRQLTPEETENYLLMGLITVSPFKHQTAQEFPEVYPEKLDLDELNRTRAELRVPENYETLPRTMFFRINSKDKMQVKKRLAESLDTSAYIPLGKFAEGKCGIFDEQESEGLVLGTCLPYKTEKDKCELISLEFKPNGCGHVIKVGCSRLCRIKPLAYAVYDSLDSQTVFCTK